MTLNARKRASAKAVTALLIQLIAGGGTYAKLCAASGLSQPVLSSWIREWRAAHLVYIAAWRNDSRGIPTIPSFCWGACGDMPRRAGKPAAQRVAEWRARKAVT